MIHLYTKDNTNYEANGDIILLPVRCEATAGINRTWQIDLEHPIDEEGRWKYIVADAVIKCPSFNGTQLWRIVQTEKRDTGVLATCDPIFYDAAHEVVFVERITLNGYTCQQALDRLTEGTKYSGTSNIHGTASMWFATENLVETITGNEHGLVKHFDGEVAFDNYSVHIESELGGDYGASVVYGKNLAVDGISESFDIDGTVTRIIPIAYNGHLLPELYVDSENIDIYPFPRIGFIQYDNLRLWSEREEGEEGDSTTEYFNSEEELFEAMREAAEKEYTDNELDRPSVGLEVNMVMIQNTQEYKDFKDLEQVSIGDYVRCYNPRIGIDSKTRVRALVYDCIRESVISVELGKEKRNYFDNVTSMIDRVGNTITPGGTVMAQKIAGIINGAYAQLRLQNTIARKQDVRAIMFEDLDPESPTFGALAIGTQGWEISSERTLDNKDWVWTTAATSKGIIADVIVTGLIADKLGRNYWDLDTGEFSLTGVTIADADIEGYATDAELSAVDTKATNAGTAAATADGKAVTAQGMASAAQGTADTAITRLNGQYGTCTVAAGTATKTVNLTNASGFELYPGAKVCVYFTNTNTAASPTLNVGGTGAKPIYVQGATIASEYYWSAKSNVTFTYNGSQWVMDVDDAQMTFNHLTKGGTIQGLYQVTTGAAPGLYMNAAYIKTGYLSADVIDAHSLNVDKIGGSITNGNWGINFTNGSMSIGTLAVGKITGVLGSTAANNWGIDFTNGTMSIGTLNVANITGVVGDNSSTGGSYVNFDTDTVIVRKLNASAITTGTLTGITISGDTIRVGGTSSTTGGGGSLYVYNSSGTQIGSWTSAGINVSSGSISGTTITSTSSGAGTVTISNGTVESVNGSDRAVLGTGYLYTVNGSNDAMLWRNYLDLSSGNNTARYTLNSTGPRIEGNGGTGQSNTWTFNRTTGGINVAYVYTSAGVGYTGGAIPHLITKTVTQSYTVGSSTSTLTWYCEWNAHSKRIKAYCKANLSSSASNANKSATIPLPDTFSNANYVIIGTPVLGSGVNLDTQVKVMTQSTTQFTTACNLKEASTSNVPVWFYVEGSCSWLN